jgi:hypothetical protein
MEITEDAYLAHFGVKGMKWGVRRERRIKEETEKLVKDHGWTEARAKRAATYRDQQRTRAKVSLALMATSFILKVGSRYAREMRYGSLVEQARNSPGGEFVDEQLRDAGQDPSWRGSTSTRAINETLITISRGRDFVNTRRNVPKYMRDAARRIDVDDAMDVYSNVAGPVRIAGALGRGG